MRVLELYFASVLSSALSIWVLVLVVPFFRTHLRGTPALSVALGVGFAAVGETSFSLPHAAFTGVASSLIIAVPLLVLSEYLSVTARGVDLLRGALWAEQMLGEERNSSIEQLTLLTTASLILSDERRFAVLERLLLAKNSAPSLTESAGALQAAFSNSVELLLPFISSIMLVELAQGLVQRVTRRGQIESAIIRLLLAALFLATTFPERIVTFAIKIGE